MQGNKREIMLETPPEVGRLPLDLEDQIIRLKKELNAVILAHYYQESEIQDLADVVGDSLELSRRAAATDADVIVFAGVHFMAGAAKILNPAKQVLLPDLGAGCSLQRVSRSGVQEFIAQHPAVSW
jgi:quinolinate synthase